MSEIRFIHYFEDSEQAKLDFILTACKNQGYVPQGCLLVGQLVYGLVAKGDDPCKGCQGDRLICGGRPE